MIEFLNGISSKLVLWNYNLSFQLVMNSNPQTGDVYFSSITWKVVIPPSFLLSDSSWCRVLNKITFCFALHFLKTFYFNERHREKKYREIPEHYLVLDYCSGRDWYWDLRASGMSLSIAIMLSPQLLLCILLEISLTSLLNICNVICFINEKWALRPVGCILVHW